MNNKNTFLLVILLICVMIASILALSKDESIESEYHRLYNPLNEVGDLNNYITSNYKSFNKIIVNSYLNNNTLDNIEIFDNKNKILFAFEHMFKYKDYDKEFISLDSKKYKPTNKAANEKDVISYMNSNDFKPYYEKIINEELDISSKENSIYNTEYDNNDNYIYYKNFNTNYSVDSIIVTNSTIDDNYIITCELNIIFNKQLKKAIKKDNIRANIKYTYLKDDVVKIISIKTKTSS